MNPLLLFLSALGCILPLAAAAAAGGCHKEPYDHMQHYRHWDPARKFCHHHWPGPTIRKTVTPKCLTTTSTVVEGSTTVTATKTKHCSTGEHSPPPSSVYPVPYEKTKREAAPAPTSPVSKREAVPAPDWGSGKGDHPWEYRPEPYGHHDAGDHTGWKDYLDRLNRCGYECVQRACSCIARTHTIHHTPSPTCTKTSTRHTIITSTTTTTVIPPGYKCEHDGGWGHYPGDPHHPGGPW